VRADSAWPGVNILYAQSRRLRWTAAVCVTLFGYRKIKKAGRYVSIEKRADFVILQGGIERWPDNQYPQLESRAEIFCGQQGV